MDFPVIWTPLFAAASGLSLMKILTVTWYVILVILGVNMLIIVHEFGHFMVARMCGVRCDKFYIWFDIYGWRFFRFKWGDTEYGLGVLPLGGYVKMFGQEDSPGAMKAEIERAKLAAAQPQSDGNSRPTASTEELVQMEKSLYAPDSYLSKSVPQRMAIIVAGVVMNVIFAFICGIGAYLFGMDAVPCVVGGTSPGSSSWESGLQPGDKILTIDDKPVRLFGEISQSVVSSTAEKLKLEVERVGVSEPIILYAAPKMKKHDLYAKLGIAPPGSLKLDKDEPVSELVFPLKGEHSLKGGETLVAVNGEKMDSYEVFYTIMKQRVNQPLTCTFERKNKDGTVSSVELIIPAVPSHTLRFSFEMGAITAVRPEAEKAGLAVGDMIQTIEGEPVDPLQLAAKILNHVQAGKEQLSIVVKRGDETKTIEMPVALDSVEKQMSDDSVGLGSPILGIAYDVASNVGHVSAQDKAIPMGATVTGMTISKQTFKTIKKRYKDFGKSVKDGFCYTNEERGVPFPLILDDIVRLLPLGTEVTLHVKNEDKILDFPLTVYEDVTYEPQRGLNFIPQTFFYQAESFGEAVEMGTTETVKSLFLVYHFIRSMTVGQVTGTSRVSAKGMGGPLAIIDIAYRSASSGMGPFLILLCLLGANLAVLNILPIPVLDGGHVVFLAYEAIFRKPPNEAVQVILSYMGLFLLLSLMVWVFALDLGFVKRM